MGSTDLPSADDLSVLSLRAIVAYAARCAQRVQPVFRSDNEDCVAAVAAAIAIARRFAQGEEIGRAVARAAAARAVAARAATRACFASDAGAGYAAADAAAAASAAARAAANVRAAAIARARAAAASDAAAAARAAAARAAAGGGYAAAAARGAAVGDYERLRLISGKQCGDVGDPIDLSEDGPLGPLWPEGPPKGWPEQQADDYVRHTAGQESLAASLSVYLDPGDAPAEVLTDFFVALASVYMSMGGSGLKIAKDERRSFVAVEAES